jgi:predicted DNA binding CopG/RHH family protein
MRRRGFYDDEERDLITAYERGEFSPVTDQQRVQRSAVKAARRYLRKDARINIRLSTADLEMLKRRAAQEGLPPLKGTKSEHIFSHPTTCKCEPSRCSKPSPLRLLAPAIFLNLKPEAHDFNGLIPRARVRERTDPHPRPWHASRLSIRPASMWASQSDRTGEDGSSRRRQCDDILNMILIMLT